MSGWAEPVWLGSHREDARFGELYGRYYRSVHAYCRRRLASDAVDDAVAEVFLTAWRRLPDVPDGDGALVWLYGVAHRVIGTPSWMRPRLPPTTGCLTVTPAGSS
jgi:hypothetical protein